MADWGGSVSASCTVGQLSVSAGNGWPHNALRHHWLMPLSCHFRDCKALLVTSLTRVSGAIASVQTFTFFTFDMSRVDLSSGLRQLASSAAAASNSMTSLQSAETLTYIMTSVIAAHRDTCIHTTDKVVMGKFKYDTLMSSKPPVPAFH